MYVIFSKIGKYTAYIIIFYTIIATATAIIYIDKYASLKKYIALLEEKIQDKNKPVIEYKKTLVPVDLTEKQKQDIMLKYNMKIDELNALIAGLRQEIRTVSINQTSIEPENPNHASPAYSPHKNLWSVTCWTDSMSFSYMRNFSGLWLGINWRTPAYAGVTVAREY